ncbi:type II secretion system secretin GspD [Rhodoferax sp. AJA081-3]|uniref:type II secretion system secretin GspD n=1 Tax=Rhodoferax sp. AJA081-3 TaxID=2752316 RepID=UPI001ADFF1FC|nr:type II secretion system secretin GspD [Rhodoferax sp. AJA081-3]QTN26111.1 type II secretion system secretin GspD [Rhodoferax sp. AJA081-3]
MLETKKADADAPKIIPGTGIFVKPANMAAAPAGPQDIVLNFEGADLREVVRVVMGDMLGENYTIDPKVNGAVTIHTSQPINRAAVTPILETVLRMNGAAMVKENGAYKISPLNTALRGSTTPKTGVLQPGYSVQIVQLQYISAREMAKILEPLLPEGSILRVDESRNLLMLAGGEGEMRHALETVSVFDLDWLAGMSVGLFTLKSADVKSILPELEILFGDKSKTPFAGLLRILPIERMNAVFVVSPRPQYLEQARQWIERLDRSGGRSGTRLHVYPVQNGNAEKIAALLSQVIGGKSTSSTPAATVAPGLVGTSLQSTGGSTSGAPGGLSSSTSGSSTAGAPMGANTTNSSASVVASGTGEALGLSAASTVKVIADRDNNTLLILANGAEYEKIEEAIRKLDVVPRQVLVEVTIAEVTLGGALNYGLEWFFNNGTNGLTGKLVNAYGSNGSRGSALPTNSAEAVTSVLPFTAVWRTTGGNISAVLSALASTTKVNVLSSPHIMVTDNQVAKINVGSSVPVQGQSTISGVAGTPITTSVNYVDTGVVLSVRPHINAGGLVTLEVSQEVSDVAETTSSEIKSPTINKRTAQTTVNVQSGDTMVLAGLIKDNKTAGSQGLPLLSDIPVVGALFGAKSATNERSELIITITPRVVNDYQQARDITAEFRKKLTGMNKLNLEEAASVKRERDAAAQAEGAKVQ